jgi:hypothetical protein
MPEVFGVPGFSLLPLTAKPSWYNDEVGRIGLHFGIFLTCVSNSSNNQRQEAIHD